MQNLVFMLFLKGANKLLHLFLESIKFIMIACPIWFLYINVYWLKMDLKSMVIVYGFFYLIILSFLVYNDCSELGLYYLLSNTISVILMLILQYAKRKWKKFSDKGEDSQSS